MIPLDEGLRIVLSPTKLAAILSGAHLDPHEIMMNRLSGGATAVTGLVEIICGGALLAAPEPTMVTKAGGVVLSAHGVDTLSAGMRQTVSGEPVNTLTQQAGESAAYKLGANNRQAERAGMIVDIAVPFIVSFAIGAARIAGVRAGRIALAEHEAMGGHTILKHVGQTEAQLRARLLAEKGIPAASSFASLRVAELFISEAIHKEAANIKIWAAGPKIGKYVFEYTASKNCGYAILRTSGKLVDTRKALIVLRSTNVNGKLYLILTAFPVPK